MSCTRARTLSCNRQYVSGNCKTMRSQDSLRTSNVAQNHHHHQRQLPRSVQRRPRFEMTSLFPASKPVSAVRRLSGQGNDVSFTADISSSSSNKTNRRRSSRRIVRQSSWIERVSDLPFTLQLKIESYWDELDFADLGYPVGLALNGASFLIKLGSGAAHLTALGRERISNWSWLRSSDSPVEQKLEQLKHVKAGGMALVRVASFPSIRRQQKVNTREGRASRQSWLTFFHAHAYFLSLSGHLSFDHPDLDFSGQRWLHLDQTPNVSIKEQERAGSFTQRLLGGDRGARRTKLYGSFQVCFHTYQPARHTPMRTDSSPPRQRPRLWLLQ